jgi:hypothetical protein
MAELPAPAPRGRPPDIPDAQVHHWAGAVLVPHITLDRLLERLRTEAGHEAAFHEDVIASRVVARDGDRWRVAMTLRRTAVVTVTYDTEYAVDFRRLGPRRASSRSVATRIIELENAGTALERPKAPGADRGFLWRLNAYWRYEEVAGGVLVECESVSLSRRVPALLRPVVEPIVARIARESLVKTLLETRARLST